MPAHWDWAISQVDAMPGVTHVTVLTDRMVFKRGALAILTGLMADSPDLIVSYNHDVVDDYAKPIRLLCNKWSGWTVEVQAVSLLELSARMVHHQVLQRLLNCVAPVSHLRAVRDTFGNF